jgi:transposase
MTTLILGGDIAKTTVVVAAWQADTRKPTGVGTFATTEAGFAQLGAAVAALAARQQAGAVQLVLEPTGGYELALARWAHAQGWQVGLPNPKAVRDWARGMGVRAKTDRVDARVLAQFGAHTRVRPWQPLPAPVTDLEHLLGRQQDLQTVLQAERNRRDALALDGGAPAVVVASVQTAITAMEQALTTIDTAIRDHLQQHPTLAADAARLRTVPGVGEKTVRWLLVLLHKWRVRTAGQGTAKGLTAFVGLDPMPYQSGTSVQRRPRISKAGSAAQRRNLYLAALGGIRGHTVLRTFYQRLVARGRPKRVALLAAARKILVWAWAVFRAQTRFDPTHAAAAATATTVPAPAVAVPA